MKRFSAVLIIIAGMLWGSMGLLIRRLNALGLESMQIVELRAFTACVTLLLILIIKDRRLFFIRPKDLWCFLGTGICSIIFFNYCYFKAIEIASLSVAAVLLYTAPVIVMLLSYFLFREKFTGRKALALVMTVAGCTLVTGVLDSENAVSPAGIMAGLGAGFGYALYSIFGRYAIKRGYSSLTITFYTFVTAFVGSLFFADFRGVAQVAFQNVSTSAVSVGLGVLCTVLPFFMYTKGLAGVENGKASIYASVEPVTATILGVLVFRERMSVCSAVGVVLVIAALIICGNAEPENS